MGRADLFSRSRHCKFLIERSQNQKDSAGTPGRSVWWWGSYLITFLHYWICLHCIPCLWPGSSCAWRGWRERSTWGSVWAWAPPPATRSCRSFPWPSRTARDKIIVIRVLQFRHQCSMLQFTSIFRIFEKCALYQLYPVTFFKFQQEEGALSKYLNILLYCNCNYQKDCYIELL